MIQQQSPTPRPQIPPEDRWRTFNVEFQRALGRPVQRTLATLRTTLFAWGAILGASGRRPILRLSTAMEHPAPKLSDELNCNIETLSDDRHGCGESAYHDREVKKWA